MGGRVFVTHIMKTAGSSLTLALHPHVAPAARYPRDGDEAMWRKADIAALLAIRPDVRDEIALFSVHMPAWVGREVAPDALQVTVLREPVARTVSHLRQVARALGVDDLDALYADPALRPRLADYQTRALALERRDHEEQRVRAASEAERLRAGVHSPDERDALEAALVPAMLTLVPEAPPLDGSHLERARRRLDGFDVVGTTGTLDATLASIRRATGWEIGAPPRHNIGVDELRVSDTLRAAIRRDQQLDLELYAAAQERAGATG